MGAVYDRCPARRGGQLPAVRLRSGRGRASPGVRVMPVGGQLRRSCNGGEGRSARCQQRATRSGPSTTASLRATSRNKGAAPRTPSAAKPAAVGPANRSESTDASPSATASPTMLNQLIARQSGTIAWMRPYMTVSNGFGVTVTKASSPFPLTIRSKWMTDPALSKSTGPALNGRMTHAQTNRPSNAGTPKATYTRRCLCGTSGILRPQTESSFACRSEPSGYTRLHASEPNSLTDRGRRRIRAPRGHTS